MLVLDETYRDFLSRDDRPHALFADPSWRDWLVHLYSFSKSYRLTGHRTGAMIASRERLAEAEKVLAQDFPTIPLSFSLAVSFHSERVDNVVLDPFSGSTKLRLLNYVG